MGVKETYNARIGMQESLDLWLPRGAFVVVLETIGGRLIPSGVELTTGRVFCSDAREDDGGWSYQLMVDPRVEEQEAGLFEQPFTCWITELDVENDPMFEAEIQDDPDAALSVIRLRSDPAGPRKPRTGQREFITQLRERELFPRGLQASTQEVLDEGDTG